MDAKVKVLHRLAAVATSTGDARLANWFEGSDSSATKEEHVQVRHLLQWTTVQIVVADFGDVARRVCLDTVDHQDMFAATEVNGYQGHVVVDKRAAAEDHSTSLVQEQLDHIGKRLRR